MYTCLFQRVYGIAFPDKNLMKEYKKRVEEAKKRDHRCVCVCVNVRLKLNYTVVFTYIYTHMHIHIHTYTHTHTPIRRLIGKQQNLFFFDDISPGSAFFRCVVKSVCLCMCIHIY
jgi:threonyl-tRNA synthetase